MNAMIPARHFQPISGVITEYREFVEAMVSRRNDLGLSQLDVDAIAGFAEAHCGKLENWDTAWGRGMGSRTMPLWLGALKCGIVLIDKRGNPMEVDAPTARHLSVVRHAR